MTYYSVSTLLPVNPPRGVQYGDPTRWWDTRVGAPDRDVHLAAVGIVVLDDTAIRPADTETQTSDRTVELVAGVPTVVYVQRLWTQAELDAQAAAANSAALRSDPQTQIDALLAVIVALDEITSRTNATINANPAVAIKDVARELLTVTRRTVRLARLQLGALNSVDGTG